MTAKSEKVVLTLFAAVILAFLLIINFENPLKAKNPASPRFKIEDFRFDGTFSMADTADILKTYLPLGSNIKKVSMILVSIGGGTAGQSGFVNDEQVAHTLSDDELSSKIIKSAYSYVTYQQKLKRSLTNLDTGGALIAYFDKNGDLILITYQGNALY